MVVSVVLLWSKLNYFLLNKKMPTIIFIKNKQLNNYPLFIFRVSKEVKEELRAIKKSPEFKNKTWNDLANEWVKKLRGIV